MTGAISYHPYGSAAYPYQLNDPAYRKNATRDATATLKAWLNEHRKNPYPTKGEKIMLAIITKMTLTQVSTWFANARRRLKKENKMTWAPKNKGGEEKKAEGGAEESLDCFKRDTKGSAHFPLPFRGYTSPLGIAVCTLCGRFCLPWGLCLSSPPPQFPTECCHLRKTSILLRPESYPSYHLSCHLLKFPLPYLLL